MKTNKCTKCNRDIRVNNYKRHVDVCEGKQKTLIKEEWKVKENLYKCPWCGKTETKKEFLNQLER